MVTTITKFGKETVKELRPQIDRALIELGERYGLTIRALNASFDDTTVTFKLEVKVNDTAALEAAERKTFNDWCHLYGLEPKHFGTTIESRAHGKQTLVGIDTRRPKFGLKFRNGLGKITLFTDAIAEAVKIAHSKQEKVA